MKFIAYNMSFKITNFITGRKIAGHSLFREGKPHIRIARSLMQLPSPTGDDNILSSLYFVYRMRRKTRCRQTRFPEQLTRPFIKGPDLRIAGGGNKEQTAGRYDRAAIVFRSGMYTLSLKFRIVAQGIAPGNGSPVEIDGGECSPGWRNSRISFPGQEFIITGSAVG